MDGDSGHEEENAGLVDDSGWNTLLFYTEHGQAEFAEQSLHRADSSAIVFLLVFISTVHHTRIFCPLWKSLGRRRKVMPSPRCALLLPKCLRLAASSSPSPVVQCQIVDMLQSLASFINPLHSCFAMTVNIMLLKLILSRKIQSGDIAAVQTREEHTLLQWSSPETLATWNRLLATMKLQPQPTIPLLTQPRVSLRLRRVFSLACSCASSLPQCVFISLLLACLHSLLPLLHSSSSFP